MNIEQKIRKPHIRKLIIWALIVIVLGVTCCLYHSSPSPRFEPVVSIALITAIAAYLFWMFDIQKFLFDSTFSGKIVHIKADVRFYKESAFDRGVTTRTYVGMTVECDDGKSIFFEQMLPAHLTTKIPYRVGDRVYHIKGSKHTCRFPRGDTETKYEPISVICPICGALLPLGSKDCSFCESELPYDPAIK